MSIIKDAIRQTLAGNDLSMEQMGRTIGLIMDGKSQEDEIVELLVALHNKGETSDEVAGAAQAMRDHVTPIRCKYDSFIDVVGTGGDESHTFNISTAAAIVTAAAGVPVAKHGNRKFTSRSGSADVLQALGVNIEADVALVERCVNTLGLCFCFAPLLHSAMRYVGPARRRIETPTIFNNLGPLSNPAGAPFQLLGVGPAFDAQFMADALVQLGTRRVCVVHGLDGLDEVTLDGPTRVIEVTGNTTREFEWTAETFGLKSSGKDQMLISSPEESAAIIRSVLAGEKGSCRDIVVINTAAAIWTAGLDSSPVACAERAADALDSGSASKLLDDLIQMTNADHA